MIIMKNNLYYFVVGVKAYYEQMKWMRIDIAPTKEKLMIKEYDKGINIYHAPDINKAGFVLAAANRTLFTRKQYIMIDNRFLELDKDLQEGILAHELGHCHQRHLLNKSIIKETYKSFVFIGKMLVLSEEEKNLLIETSINNRDISIELEADAWAVKKVGQEAVKRVLLYLYSIAPSPEIKERYKAVTGKELPDVLSSTFKDLFKSANAVSLKDLE